MPKKHNRIEGKFFERCRIILSKKFNVPPDYIDISTIMECVKRSIRNSCNDPDGKIVISAKTEKEQKALYNYSRHKKKNKMEKNAESKVPKDLGMRIVDMVFDQQYPFCNWVDYYHEAYGLSYIREKIREDESDEEKDR